MATTPTGQDFDIFDWSPESGDVGGSFGLLSSSDLLQAPSQSPPLIEAISVDSVRFRAPAVASPTPLGSVSRVAVSLGIPSTYTLEFSTRLVTLPRSDDLPSHYIFVGVSDAQGGTGGILLSDDGVAIAGGPEGSVVYLPGSEGLLYEDGEILGEDLVFRLVVQHELDRADLYVTPSSVLAEAGHVLRYTLPIPASSLGLGDAAVIELRGPAQMLPDGTPIPPPEMLLKSFRLSSEALIPNKRPVAVATAPETANKAQIVQLLSEGSYDPEEANLTYKWTILQQPDGSDISLSGSRPAEGVTGNTLRLYFTDQPSPGFTVGATVYNGTAEELSSAVGTVEEINVSSEYVLVATSEGEFEIGDTVTDGSGSMTVVTTSYGDRIRFISKLPGSQGDGQRIQIVKELVVQPLSMAVDEGGVITITLRYDGAGPLGTTTAQELYDTLNDPTLEGRNAEVAALVSAELPADGFNAVGMSSDTVVLANGADSAAESPTFYATHVGAYKFELVVNDGELDSLPTTVVLTCLEAGTGIGYVPDADFVWNYLPDFWQKIQDRGRMSNFWGGLIQLVGAEMLRTWGIDYNKSLRDIPELMPHRWYGFSTRVVPEPFFDKDEDGNDVRRLGYLRNPSGPAITLSCTPVDDPDRNLLTNAFSFREEYRNAGFPALAPGDVLTVVTEDGGPQLSTVRRFEPFKLHKTSGSISADSNVFSDTSVDFFSYGVKKGDTLTLPTDPAKYQMFTITSVSKNSLELKETFTISASSVEYQVGGLVFTENANIPTYSVVDEAERTGQALSSTTFGLSYGSFSSQIQPGDWLYLPEEDWDAALDGSADNPVLINTVSSDELGLDSSIPTDWAGKNWKVLRDRREAGVTIEHSPYFELREDLDGKVRPGDLVVLGARNKPSVIGEVLSVGRAGVGFRASGIDETYELVEFVCTLGVTGPEEVRTVPRIQSSGSTQATILTHPADFSLSDYTTRDGEILRQLTLTEGPADGALSGSIFSSGSSDFSGLAGSYIRIDIRNGHPYGYYKIAEVLSQTSVRLEGVSGDASYSALSFTVMEYHPENLPPPNWWAEYVYVDNGEAIENNFGVLVGLEREDLPAVGADYLPAVKAVWFALWHGPTISNIQLGAQAFFNLPFAERAGLIIDIDTTYREDQGRILVQDRDNSQIVRSYYYPLAAGIAHNPQAFQILGSALVEGSRVIEGIPELSREQAEDYARDLIAGRAIPHEAAYREWRPSLTSRVESTDYFPYTVGDTVEAFAPLSRGVEVSDYVKDPDWYDSYLTGGNSLKKYHTFKVELDFDAVGSGDAIDLVVDFVDKIKPVHTDYLLIGVKALADQVSVADTPYFLGTLEMVDDAYSTEDGALYPSSGSEGVTDSVALTVGEHDTFTLPAGITSDDEHVVGMVFRTLTGADKGQVRRIISYDTGTRDYVLDHPVVITEAATVDVAITTLPTVSGHAHHFDHYDGQGNWWPKLAEVNGEQRGTDWSFDPLVADEDQLLSPYGGEEPTALVDYDSGSLTGPFYPGERIRLTNASGRILGEVADHESHNDRLVLAISGGSLPEVGVTLYGETSGNTADVTARTLGKWPTYAPIHRARSRVWLPLQYETIRGPEATPAGLYVDEYDWDGTTARVKLAAGTLSTEDDFYTNWVVTMAGGAYDGEYRRITDFDGSTGWATLASEFSTTDNDPDIEGEDCTLHYPRYYSRIAPGEFFPRGSVVTGQVSGAQATIVYAGPSYLLVEDVKNAPTPYHSFVPGEQVLGHRAEIATIVDDVIFVYPDGLGAADRLGEVGPDPHAEYRVCFDVGTDGVSMTLDMGMILDDVEVYQYPEDPVLGVELVPNLHPGLYWWLDKKVVYNYESDGAGGWLPVPDVDKTETNGGPTWHSQVVHDLTLCRTVSMDDDPATPVDPEPDFTIPLGGGPPVFP